MIAHWCEDQQEARSSISSTSSSVISIQPWSNYIKLYLVLKGLY